MENTELEQKRAFRSTYRLQLRKEFTLGDATELVPYLDQLGISHIYLSPLLESKAGSPHGYDVINPTQVSKERGGERGLASLIRKVRAAKDLKGCILDIVPNHVCAHSSNPFWWSVLKNGPESPYWNYFDIRPYRKNDLRIVLPVLGRSRQSVLNSGEFKIIKNSGEYILTYWDHRFPLRKESQDRARTIFESHTSGIEPMYRLLEDQYYILEDWQEGRRKINYRRFFDINDLAAIRIEDPEVFRWAHQKISELLRKYPEIHGLRVDHIDGLSDPEMYLNQLAEISKLVWVEKILGDDEKLPSTWKTMGETGYEFSNVTARLFVDFAGLMRLHSHYIQSIDGRWERFHDCVYQSKKEIIESHFVSEVKFLTSGLYQMAETELGGVSFEKYEMKQALVELTCALKVYRTYISRRNPNGAGSFDLRWLEKAFEEVEGRGMLVSSEPLNWLKTFLFSTHREDVGYKWVKKWEQLTGPVMAKGLEDTALYRYFPLLSLNVVGGEPDWLGDGRIEFHSFNISRLRERPYSLSTTSTHDTKRSEDVRSRIHVLSDLSEEWLRNFEKWYKWNHPKSTKPKFPDAHTEYFIYETLIGVWPLSGKLEVEWRERLKAFLVKASREAKSKTSWLQPDLEYEERLAEYVEYLLKPQSKRGREFLKDFKAFAEKCAYYGAFNSLSLLSLKLCSPGVADFYQGSELWDLSLVDPDNRRPVDYKVRQRLLNNIRKRAKKDKTYIDRVLLEWKTGEVKLWLTYELLQMRLKNAALFTEGSYSPLEFEGECKPHIIGFTRSYQGQWCVVIVPRLLARLTDYKRSLRINSSSFSHLQFQLPKEAPRNWQNILTKDTLSLKAEEKECRLGDWIGNLPVGVWLSI